MINSTAPIGVFDSGLGGLEITSQIANAFPNENLIYLGDTARVPYGTRSPDRVKAYTIQAADFLVNQGIKALVIACNTASCYALKTLQERYSIPIFGMINPGVQAASLSKTGVLVLATSGTIRSQAYQHALSHANSNRIVVPLACPLFVPLVETGWIDRPLTGEIIKEHLSCLMQPPFSTLNLNKIDLCLLGCTHYPLLKPFIHRALSYVLGRSVHIVDGGRALINHLKTRLHSSLSTTISSPLPKYRFYTTDQSQSMIETAQRFWKTQNHIDLPPLTHIVLNDCHPKGI